MRTPNLTSKDSCRYCDNSGWVVYDPGTPPSDVERMHHEVREAAGVTDRRKLPRQVLCGLPIRGEAMAPCPFCEQGYANEFPETDDAGKKFEPYGTPDGFWFDKQQDLDAVALLNAKRAPVPVPLVEARRLMAEMTERLAKRSEVFAGNDTRKETT